MPETRGETLGLTREDGAREGGPCLPCGPQEVPDSGAVCTGSLRSGGHVESVRIWAKAEQDGQQIERERGQKEVSP